MRSFAAANQVRLGPGRRIGDAQRLRAKDAELTALGRCKCGLWKPCGNCLPTLLELATSRPGGGPALPEAPSGLSEVYEALKVTKGKR